MSERPKVAIIVGSLRKTSVNRRLAQAIARQAAPKLDMQIVEIDQVPLYNQDLEADFPGEVQAVKDALSAADAILVVTPEYNRGMPGVLKNVIDWASRPPGQSVWRGKPVAIAGSTPGALGTGAAQVDARNVLTAIDAAVMGMPQIYFVHREEHFTPEGDFADPKFRDYIQAWIDKFAAWIARVNG